MTDVITRPSEIAPAHDLVVRPLSGHTGAQIDGIDLSVPLTDAERRVVSDALARWKVVFFRGQDIGHR